MISLDWGMFVKEVSQGIKILIAEKTVLNGH